MSGNESTTASPSPSPVAAAGGAAAAAAAAPAAPAELFIPSHTRAWQREVRARYDKYVATREVKEVSNIIGEQNASAGSDAAVREAATPAPVPAALVSGSAGASAALAASCASLCAAPAPGSLPARGRLIQMGDQALVDFGRGQAWLNLDGVTSRTLRLAKSTARTDNLAGQPYGNVWELDGKSQKLTRTNRKRGLGTALLDADVPDASRNNSQLFDTNAAQALSQEEIEALKGAESAVSGEQLVDMLVSNSATFASKTAFSQEKYLKKKRAKHLTEVVVLPVTLARLAEAFWQKDPKKIRGLRPDMLSLLLSTANVRAGASSLVVDSCSGLVLAALLYRTQGLSYVVHAFENNQKRTEAVKRFNFSADIHAALVHVPLDKVLSKQVALAQPDGSLAPLVTPAAAAAAAAAGSSDAAAAAHAAMDTSDSAAVAAATDSASASAAAAASSPPPQQDLTGEQVLSHQVDTLILASKYEPWHLLSSLWAYLRPGGRFVVFDECIEPLASAHAKLTASDMAVNVVLSEQFFRNQQVLPNRTHPFVNMSASGGYILSGSKMRPAVPSSSPTAASANAK
jgi:tRNA (adenine-N(1)-)-methyltransferase non-catalytic subunit